MPYVDHKLIYHSLITVGPFKSQNDWGEHDHGDKYLVMLINERIAVSIRAPFPMITFSKIWRMMGYSVQTLRHACFLAPNHQPRDRCQKNIQMLRLHQHWYTSVWHFEHLAQL